MDDHRQPEGGKQGEIERLQERVADLEARLAGRKASIVALDVNDNLLDTFTELVPTALYVYQDGELAYANRIASELVGLDPTTASPTDVFSQLDEEFQKKVHERARARIKGEQVPNSYEIRLTHRSGEKVWLLMQVHLITYRGRTASLAAAIDITDRKQVEEELRASQASLAAIVENTSDYILLSDHTGSPVYFNSAYAAVMKELLGLDMKPGIKPHMLLPDAAEREKWDEYHRRVLSGERFTTEYCYEGGETGPVYLEVSYYPVQDGDEIVGFCEFTHDVTTRKLSEERLARVQQERVAQLRQIAGGLSHEIHNALFPANTTLHKLRDHLEAAQSSDDPRNLRLLDLALKSLQRAMDLTASVRLFSKLDRFQADEITDLSGTIKNVLNQQEDRLMETQVMVSVDIEPSLLVRCPASHLYSVFDNLIVNAIDAMAEGGGGTVSIIAGPENGGVVVSLADTGPGMSAEALERVFEPFFTTKVGFGTGLGLAIVKRVVDLCGGTVTVDSEPGVGTTFVIRLPAGKVQD